MPRKTWVKVKRGLLTPQHRVRIGVRLWLYLHILDRADWEQGAVLQWQDAAEAEDLGMDTPTVRSQRRQLEADGYIRCERHGHYQRIVILKWVNPREYSGKVYNPPHMADMVDEPSGGKSTLADPTPAPAVPSDGSSDNPSDRPSDNPSDRFSQPLPYSSQSHTSQITESESSSSVDEEDDNLGRIAEIDRLLSAAGAGRKAREKLAHSDISADYVRRHLRRVQRYDEPLRYALQRMLEGEPPGICPLCEAILPRHRHVTDKSADEIIECPLRRSERPDLQTREQLEAYLTEFFDQRSMLSEFDSIADPT